MTHSRALTMLLLGGNPHSDNRGVSALGLASLANLHAAFPQARLIVADSGLAERVSLPVNGEAFDVEKSWIRPCRSVRRRSGTRHLSLLRRLQPWMPRSVHSRICSRAFKQLREADVVLDLSGGDSFADLYGERRFQKEASIKQLALAMRKPLVLLPQTFGPFTSGRAIRAARRIIRSSVLVASRDLGGTQQLEQLAGPEIGSRLASCPDVAFTLEPAPIGQEQLPALLRSHRHGPVIGLNVSGWLYTRQSHVPLAVEYRDLVSAIIRWVTSLPRSKLLLLPHVFGPNRAVEPSAFGIGLDASDLEASLLVQQQWQDRFGSRLECVRQPMGATQLKYVIGHCDFFIGARMHACIAAASQCVPTLVLGYSRKAEGVFGMIGARSMIADMREATVQGLMAQTIALFRRRNTLRDVLRAQMSGTKEAVTTFFEERLPSALSNVGLAQGTDGGTGLLGA